jgi:hypothetical protein
LHKECCKVLQHCRTVGSRCKLTLHSGLASAWKDFRLLTDVCAYTICREIVSIVPPLPQDSSSFVSIDDVAFEEYRNSSGEGGCACKPDGCVSARCRKCCGQELPCTTRCKCRGECGNPHTMPEPEYLASYDGGDPSLVPLKDIIPQLTPRDVEFWSLKNGRFGYHWF